MYRHERVGADLSDTFHATVDCWHPDSGTWDEEAGTVLPADVTTAALEAHDRYPEKRIIVHYMQPHLPFIGEYAERTGIGRDGYAHLTDDVLSGENSGFRGTVWDRLRRGEVAPEQAWRGYEESLEAAVEQVEALLETVSGRVVVTADHGNLFGERSRPLRRRQWGHPPQYHHPALVTVPWHVRDGPRRDVSADTPDQVSAVTADDVVTERLRSLGYAE
jgi:hypothetical protein